MSLYSIAEVNFVLDRGGDGSSVREGLKSEKLAFLEQGRRMWNVEDCIL